MSPEDRQAIYMVSWIQGNLKKVAIVSVIARMIVVCGMQTHTSNRYVTYATSSSVESEHMAIKDMLHNLQAELAVFAPILNVGQTKVLVHGISPSVSHNIEQITASPTVRKAKTFDSHVRDPPVLSDFVLKGRKLAHPRIS